MPPSKTQNPQKTVHDEDTDLPTVLIPKVPPSFLVIGEQPFISAKFRYLKAYDSPLPLDQFLSIHCHAVRAMLCHGGFDVTPDVLRMLPSLGLIVTTSAGLNQIDLPECRRHGVRVANTGNIYSDDVADTAVGLLIDVSRKISASDRYLRHGFWVSKGDYPLGSKLGSKRVGIVGMGNIGYEVARRLEALGCVISYNSRKAKPHVSYHYYQNVVELAANNDVLVICCALNEQTRHLINKEVMLALGKRGVIINIGRGAIVDEKELVKCLLDGEIAGAGLDVFENEPNVPKELFAMDNVVMTPHSAVFTAESFKDLSQLIVGNLEAFFANKPLLSEYIED